jgi:quercetin dioxygenase-like cupin family protein
MTHPRNTLPPKSSGQLEPSDRNHSHEHQTENDIDYLSTQDLKVIDDYLIVPQDAPLNERPAFYNSGDLYTFLTTSKETNFVFNAFDFFVPLGGGPLPHIHNYEHEAFYVAEGKVNFFLGNQAGIIGSPEDFVLDGVPTGTFLFGPRLRPHGFKNINSTEATSGDNPGARIFSITTPGELDYLFEYAGQPVEDRNDPIPPPPQGGFEPKFLELVLRTAYRGPSFPQGAVFPGYQPPADTPKYVLVLPDDAPHGLKEKIKAQVAGVEDFSIWTASERPTFTGTFGIEYTSLVSFEESKDNLDDHRLSYNQFSLQNQETDTFSQANLNGKQVVAPTQSQANGVANVDINHKGDIKYSLTVTGLDFGKLSKSGNSQTPNNELDDVTSIQINSGKRGRKGSEVFTIFDINHHHDNDDFNIKFNKNGSATIKGIWKEKEEEIPDALSDFLKNSGLPGQENDFYFEVDTKGHPTGEIRGQISHNTNDFPDQVESENYEAFYVKEGQLSFKIEDEVRLVSPNTFVTIAPGNKYSIGNFGTTEAKSLAVSIIPVEIQPVIPDDTGYSLIEGTEDKDNLVAGSKTKVVGKGGNDTLKIATGGNNLLYGGLGSDRFWIADGQLPATVADNRQPTYFGLPPLVDTQNTIVDFQLGVDKIQISGINGISSFDDLKLLPVFGDIRSTSIVATLDSKEVALANVTGILYADLSAKDFMIKKQSGNDGDTEKAELLNLKSFTGKDVKVTFTVTRDAAYKDFVSFYKVEDAQGSITDPVTGKQLKPTDAGYAQLAVKLREQEVSLTAPKSGEAIFEDTLKGGYLYAPFLIANANPTSLKDDFSKVYFPFIQGNSDKVDHIRLLGENTFGFEDLYGGGDRDYNDLTVQAKYSLV